MIRLRHNIKSALPDGDNIIEKKDILTKIPLTLTSLRPAKNCQKQPKLAPFNSKTYKLSTMDTARVYLTKYLRYYICIISSNVNNNNKKTKEVTFKNDVCCFRSFTSLTTEFVSLLEDTDYLRSGRHIRTVAVAFLRTRANV